MKRKPARSSLFLSVVLPADLVIEVKGIVADKWTWTVRRFVAEAVTRLLRDVRTGKVVL